jgi:hypothetical protein
VLTGFGSIASPVINASVIDVGGTGQAGLLQMMRTYVQTSAGVLNIELGGTDPLLFDRLAISSSMTLAGTLNVSLLEGFTPLEGSTFDIVTFSARVGGSQFESVSLPVGLSTITYDNTARRVRVS